VIKETRITAFGIEFEMYTKPVRKAYGNTDRNLLAIESANLLAGAGTIFRAHTNLNTEDFRAGTKQWTG
jgi:hypothetical protein